MSPQSKLEELFLQDVYDMIRRTGGGKDFDAVDAVARLRLYIAATGYGKTLRELFLAGGFGHRDYDRFLAAYNAQIAHRFR